MKTPYGELPEGVHTFGSVLVTVGPNGFTEQEQNLPSQTLFAPNDFIKLFTNEELIAIQLSTNPYVILGRTEVQTIITVVDLEASTTIEYLNALTQLSILTPERKTEILSGILKR